MTAKDVSVWIGIIVAILGGGVSWGVNSEKINQLEDKMEKQEAIKEQQVRMEERQKQIQSDVQEIKALIKQVAE